MNYKILVPLFTFGLFFYACSKKTETTQPTENPIINTYLPGDLLLIDQVAVYTRNGVISDPGFVQGYIDRHLNSDDARKFYVGKSYVSNPFTGTTLDFLTGSRVQLNGKILEITGVTDTVILVSEGYSDIPPVGPTQCDSLQQKVPSITPLSDCTTGACTTYRKTYPIRVFGNAYYLPFLYFAVSNPDCSSTATELPLVNIVNENLSSSLGENDSVLVQIARLPMGKTK